jgi:hypothetical protein
MRPAIPAHPRMPSDPVPLARQNKTHGSGSCVLDLVIAPVSSEAIAGRSGAPSGYRVENPAALSSGYGYPAWAASTATSSAAG